MADIQIVQGDDKHILVNFVCPNKTRTAMNLWNRSILQAKNWA